MKKALTRKELSSEIKKLQKAGKKVVFTNGCFDLLHIGHTSLFEKARSLGDVLIVAINSDKSLKGLKGPKRPLVGEKDRAKLLLALKAVDYVVVFGEQTPYELLKELKPDILVKGSDYKPEEIAGYDIVISNGGTVETVDLVQGYSTTNILQKLIK